MEKVRNFTQGQLRGDGRTVWTLVLVYIKYDALQEVTCGLFRKISHCS